jgi:tetratricopeptide (TPR) repeat protein
MRTKIFLLISAVILFSPHFILADSLPKTNIALIADKASGVDKSALVSLLEVELSQKEGINLLERAAIDKILEEQQLSASGLLDRNTTIKIGKLLRADAFIILSMENPVPEQNRVNQTQDTTDLIRVRVSETAHGLRLLDCFEQSDSTNPQESVERIVQKPNEKLIPVGIVDIHRVQLGEQYKMLERTLPLMLSVRLSLEPQIIMLERVDLKVLLDEKLRTEGSDSEFWNSAILIEGYLQPNNGRLEMHLNLKQSDGENKKSFTVQFEPNEPSIAIAQVTSEIIQNLQNSPPAAKWQPELEAEQFYKQGKMLEAHSRYEEAISLFETAHALQPDNVSFTEAVFNRAWKSYKENKMIERNNENIRDAISKSKNTQTIQSLSKRLVESPFYQFTWRIFNL